MRHVLALLLAATLPAVLQASPAEGASPQVTIYRCTDDAGHVSLRDTPCRAGSEQETRTMVRPRDAAPAPVPVAPPAAATTPAPAAEPRVIVLQPPRPMYECVTPDGDRYTSDSSDGRPRWMSIWALDHPVQTAGHDLAITGGSVRIGAGGATVTPPLPYAPWPANAVALVRDRCYAFPPAEACERLRDRRRELDHRYFNAQPSEREVLRVEKRGLQARLDADCA